MIVAKNQMCFHNLVVTTKCIVTLIMLFFFFPSMKWSFHHHCVLALYLPLSLKTLKKYWRLSSTLNGAILRNKEEFSLNKMPQQPILFMLKHGWKVSDLSVQSHIYCFIQASSGFLRHRIRRGDHIQYHRSNDISSHHSVFHLWNNDWWFGSNRVTFWDLLG